MSADMLAKLQRFASATGAGQAQLDGHLRAHLQPFPREIELRMLQFATVDQLIRCNAGPGDKEYTDELIAKRYEVAMANKN